MDIELSKIRNKASGYQRLGDDDHDKDDRNYRIDRRDNASPRSPGMSSLTRRGRGYPDSKGKGKGKARYQDEPEDEVTLLNSADRDGFAEDDGEAEAGRGHKGSQKPPVSFYALIISK